MRDLVFVLPNSNGWETPAGMEFKYSCSEDAPVTQLFEVIREQLNRFEVRLSLETPLGTEDALRRIDPLSTATVAATLPSGMRILVGF